MFKEIKDFLTSLAGCGFALLLASIPISLIIKLFIWMLK